MTHLPPRNIVDQEEAFLMKRFCHQPSLHLIKNELEETLPTPSCASFDLLQWLFREGGCYDRASRALGLGYDATRVKDYFIMVLGHLYIQPSASPVLPPTGMKQTFLASWIMQKQLKEFPGTFYQESFVKPVTYDTDQHLMEAMDDATGVNYAKAGILGRAAMKQHYVPGLSIEHTWMLRERWLATRPSDIPSSDLELSEPAKKRPRYTWTKPTTTRDLYAILREDAKDELRLWLHALQSLPMKKDDEPWKTLRLQAKEHTIAMPFTWRDLWDVRSGAHLHQSTSMKMVGVSEGVGEGMVIYPSSPTSMVPKKSILVIDALTPEWFPLFQQHPSGIITKKGSLMSHGAIQCRERHIPAIFGVCDIEKQVPAHTHIRIDGKRGTIRAI